MAITNWAMGQPGRMAVAQQGRAVRQLVSRKLMHAQCEVLVWWRRFCRGGSSQHSGSMEGGRCPNGDHSSGTRRSISRLGSLKGIEVGSLSGELSRCLVLPFVRLFVVQLHRRCSNRRDGYVCRTTKGTNQKCDDALARAVSGKGSQGVAQDCTSLLHLK